MTNDIVNQTQGAPAIAGEARDGDDQARVERDGLLADWCESGHTHALEV